MLKNKTMSVQEFLHKDDEIINESIASEIRKNSKLEKIFVFALANYMYAQNVLAIDNGALSLQKKLASIDKAGFKLLSIARTFGYWVCILMCIIDIAKSIMQGDIKGIGKIIGIYTIAFATFYFLPFIFDIIKVTF